jgi:hypothetical protein
MLPKVLRGFARGPFKVHSVTSLRGLFIRPVRQNWIVQAWQRPDATRSAQSRVDKIVAVNASKFNRVPQVSARASQRFQQESLGGHKIQ